MFFTRLLFFAALAVVYIAAQDVDANLDAEAPAPDAASPRRSGVIRRKHKLPGQTVTRVHKLPRTEKFSSHRVEGMSNGGFPGPTDPDNGPDNGRSGDFNGSGENGRGGKDPNRGPGPYIDSNGNYVDGDGDNNGGDRRGEAMRQQQYQSYLQKYRADGPRGLYADESPSSASLQGIYRLFHDLINHFHEAEQSLEHGVRDKDKDALAAIIVDAVGDSTQEGLIGKILGVAGMG